MKASLTLDEYKRAERELTAVEARRGLLIHAWITVAVVVALIVINVLVAPEFPWSVFPVIGMGIGVGFHYYGIRRLPGDVAARQADIERRGNRLSA